MTSLCSGKDFQSHTIAKLNYQFLNQLRFLNILVNHRIIDSFSQRPDCLQEDRQESSYLVYQSFTETHLVLDPRKHHLRPIRRQLAYINEGAASYGYS